MSFEHQRLIDYLQDEATKRSQNINEFASVLGISPSHLYAIRSGHQPGLQVCLDIARSLDLKPDYVLYLAGHITEEELNLPSEIPSELLPMLNKLNRMRGTPFFESARDLIEDVIDRVSKLFELAA